MTAVEINAEIIERLGAGDEIFAIEKLKHAALQTANVLASAEEDPIEAADPGSRVTALLERCDDVNEQYLAALFPTIEYGTARALKAIPRTIVHIAHETALLRPEIDVYRQSGVVVVGRIVWALVAYGLHCGRLAAISAALEATAIVPFERAEPARIVSSTRLRYPQALDGNAGNSFTHYSEWIAQRDLVCERYPLFAADFQAAINEADLVLALLASAERTRGVYCEPLYRDTVERLRTRLASLDQRKQFGELFSVVDTELEETLEGLYASLESNPRRLDRPPGRLLTAAED